MPSSRITRHGDTTKILDVGKHSRILVTRVIALNDEQVFLIRMKFNTTVLTNLFITSEHFAKGWILTFFKFEITNKCLMSL
jgi:hypothetical protein